jgi:raffinose/stachyose/melibiose transport system permease protein
MDMRRKLLKHSVNLVLIIIGLSFIFPLFWMLTLSFKTKDEVFDNAFGLPRQWVFNNYPDVLKAYDFPKYFTNSLIYSVGTILITVLLGSMLAYCIARMMNPRISKITLNYIALGLIVPVQVVIIPVFILVKQLGLKGTYMGLITPYAAFALSACVLMLYAFFRSLPKEMEEAACIDGCNVYNSFFRIIIPMVIPALVTQCVLIFMNTWNEFFLAFILASEDKLRPLTVGLLNFFVSIGVRHWGQIGAAMIITSIPTIIVYMFGNEQLEKALTAGAILK